MVFRNPQEPLLALLRTQDTRQEGADGHNTGAGILPDLNSLVKTETSNRHRVYGSQTWMLDMVHHRIHK